MGNLDDKSAFNRPPVQREARARLRELRDMQDQYVGAGQKQEMLKEFVDWPRKILTLGDIEMWLCEYRQLANNIHENSFQGASDDYRIWINSDAFCAALEQIKLNVQRMEAHEEALEELSTAETICGVCEDDA